MNLIVRNQIGCFMSCLRACGNTHSSLQLSSTQCKSEENILSLPARGLWEENNVLCFLLILKKFKKSLH
jgi:hypothetical protein